MLVLSQPSVFIPYERSLVLKVVAESDLLCSALVLRTDLKLFYKGFLEIETRVFTIRVLQGGSMANVLEDSSFTSDRITHSAKNPDVKNNFWF